MFGLKHIGCWFWCLGSCFEGQGIRWHHSFIFCRWPCLISLWKKKRKIPQLFTCASLDLDTHVSPWQPECWPGKCYVCPHCAKPHFYLYNFWTKIHRTIMLVFDTMFWGPSNPMQPFLFSVYDRARFLFQKQEIIIHHRSPHNHRGTIALTLPYHCTISVNNSVMTIIMHALDIWWWLFYSYVLSVL